MTQKNQPQSSNNGFVKWVPLLIFCVIQVGTSGDNAILTNAISALVVSFHTTVSAVQIATAIYPLTASALMVIFGLVGLIIGWKRTLQAGLIILAVGETIAFISPSVIIFTYVARVLTGVGASMAIPAVLGLTAGIYRGRDQAIAFGGLAAANGLANAIGPIIGGWIIVTWGWREAFLALAVLFAALFFAAAVVKRLEPPKTLPHFDYVGAVLIIISLILLNYGLLTVSEWGIFKPIKPPFTMLGLSPSPFLVAAGIFVFWAFVHWGERIEKRGGTAFFPSLFLKTPQVKSGLYMTALTFLFIGGFSFIVVTYLQVVVGFNAIQTGFVLATFAVGMVIYALGTPILNKNASPRLTCRLGIMTLVVACLGIMYGLETSDTNPLLLLGLFAAGAGIGLVASQASVVITSVVPEHDAEQSGGVQGAMRNIGQSIGIALVGAVLITSLTAAVKTRTAASPYLSAPLRAKAEIVTDVPFVSNQDVESILQKTKLPKEQQQALININEESRLLAARKSMFSLAIIVLLFMFGTNGLPKVSPGAEEAGENKS